MSDPVAVILAAGKSTRMKSAVPKVVHELFGRPMIDYVLDAARAAGVKRIVVVVGHQAEHVCGILSHHPDVEFALQAEQHGTGHAVMVCREQLAAHDGPLLVLAGDTPLLRSESLTGLLGALADNRAACVVGTADTPMNEGLGRVVRGAGGEFLRIVEQKDADENERRITEINTGCYAFDCQGLLDALTKIRTNNRQGEYYLTDCPAVMLAEGRPVVASCQFDIAEAMGVNTRVQLAAVRRALHERALAELMLGGVTVVDPSQVSIDPRAAIGRDTVIHPFTVIEGKAVIGERCAIGPHALVREGANLPDGTTLGPFQIAE
jgi:bifunctional UDP-N-acetylglucosamine pyrophosphorylase/glucosamine-1-phosphate N-acetyltransferase